MGGARFARIGLDAIWFVALVAMSGALIGVRF